jgi:N-glycosylase/DNA lyase
MQYKFYCIVYKFNTFCYKNNMRTVSQAVEEIIQRSPFLAEAIAEGIANNAQIARRIKPAVEKRLYEKVSEASIVMALHRMSKDLQRAPFAMRFLKHLSGITVRSNLVAFIAPNTDVLSDALEIISRNALKQ